MPVFSISRQISPEHLIYRLRFDQRLSNYFEDRNARFWREVSWPSPSKRRVKQLLTFTYLSVEKWKRIDNVNLTSNKLLLFKKPTTPKWGDAAVRSWTTGLRIVFSGKIHGNCDPGTSPDFQSISPENFTNFRNDLAYLRVQWITS